MNMTIENLVTSFAKQNKVSKAKLMSLVAEMQQVKNPTGRPVGNKAQIVRDTIRSMKTSEPFTSVDIAKKTGYDIVSVNNSLRYLMQVEKVIIQAGKQERTGARGKRPILWKFTK